MKSTTGEIGNKEKEENKTKKKSEEKEIWGYIVDDYII